MEPGGHKYKITSEDGYRLAGMLLFYLGWVLYHWEKPFFWDTILHAKAASWYVETHFESLVLPQGLDAGHTPGFNLYLAAIWSLLGRNLLVSHLAMLPFVLGAAASYFLLVNRVLPEKARPFALILFLLEPAWLTQTTLISADLGLVCFFLLCLHLQVSGQRKWLALALIGLAFVTFRGIFAVGALVLLDIFENGAKIQVKEILKKAPSYLPVAVLISLWLIWHHQKAGWWLAPPAETYGEHRQLLGLGGMLKNVAVIGWRFLDTGRAWLWLFLLTMLTLGIWRKWNPDPEFKRLVRLFILPSLLLGLIFVPFSNPIGTRYFMGSFLLFGLLVAWIFTRIQSSKIRLVLMIGLGLGLLSGHFWIYPDSISKNWDSTLAHTPYFNQRQNMADFLAENKVDPSQICTDFPNINGFQYTDLQGPDAPFGSKYETGWTNCQFVWYSNIFNGFSDQELEDLKNPNQWKLIRKMGSWPVRTELYQKK
ncbi:MAG: hypothetical protein H6581_21030 [Bacteroidia bacterium]|nr:hypothetical protein [Bacteroidia bacterium]